MTADLGAQEFISNTASTSYEPFVVEGTAIGEVHWIRNGGAEGSNLAVGLWRSDPQDFPYPFAADETLHVLEGVLEITFDDGRSVTLKPGDVASFVKGTNSHWSVREPFKKLFVVSGP